MLDASNRKYLNVSGSENTKRWLIKTTASMDASGIHGEKGNVGIKKAIVFKTHCIYMSIQENRTNIKLYSL